MVRVSIRAQDIVRGLPSERALHRSRAALLTMSAYLVGVGLLFASRVREFADETDNLLGGLLLARGERLYVDYFSSHMPLAYYVAAIPALFGASTLDQFRLFSNTLLVAATLAIVWAFRSSLPRAALVSWAIITLFAHTLQWGEMLTASTIAGFGVFAAGLTFYTAPRLCFGVRQLVGLSAAMFIAVQSELVAIFPLLLLGLCFVGVRLVELARKQTDVVQTIRGLSLALFVITAPHVLVLLGFWLGGALTDFIYDAYQFNANYYSRFVMNSSVLDMLHDWEAQYRTYLLLSLRDPLGVQTCLVLANLFATYVIFHSRGVLVAMLYYLFVGLSHVRNEGAYYLCSYFSLALSLQFGLDALRNRRTLAASVFSAAIIVTSLDFIAQVARTYDLSRRPIDAPDVAITQALTLPGERIFVAPYEPYVYLASQRMPASRYPFYFPWQSIDPRSENRLIADLRAEQPPIVIFHTNELVNGQWRAGEYGARVYESLISQGYAPLDSSSTLLADFLVRQDRLRGARERLGG